MTFCEWLEKLKHKKKSELSLQDKARYYAEYVSENTEDPVAAWAAEWYNVDFDTLSDKQKDFIKNDYTRARTSDFARLSKMSFSDWKEFYCPIPVPDFLVSYDIEQAYKSFSNPSVAVPPIVFSQWLDLYYDMTLDEYKSMLDGDSSKISYVYAYIEHLTAYLTPWKQSETAIYFALLGGDTSKLHDWVVKEFGLPDHDYGRSRFKWSDLSCHMTLTETGYAPIST